LRRLLLKLTGGAVRITYVTVHLIICTVDSGGVKFLDRDPTGRSSWWLRVHRWSENLLRRQQEQTTSHSQGSHDGCLH